MGKQCTPWARVGQAASLRGCVGKQYRCPSHGSSELVEGVVKAGWWVHCLNLEGYGLHWPYVSPYYPLPTRLLVREIDIHHHTWDTKHKSHDYFYKSSNWVFDLPKLQQLPLPQWMTGKEEQHFWLR